MKHNNFFVNTNSLNTNQIISSLHLKTRIVHLKSKKKTQVSVYHLQKYRIKNQGLSQVKQKLKKKKRKLFEIVKLQI